MSTLAPLVIALGGWSFAVGLLSIRAALRFREHARRPSADAGAASRMAPVTLIVPCCGAEPGLEGNLEALLGQDYPEYSVRFAVEKAADGAMPILERLLSLHPEKTSLVLAGSARGRSQKVQNLLAALESSPPAELLAFADSDGRPDRGWLKRLVAPLAREDVGVASSYRFYIAEPASFATLLRSVWNAAALTLLGDHPHNFAWGGAMAIRREVFERIGVRAAWEGALSDDLSLTRAVRRAGLRVAFVPTCLVASRGEVGLGELVSWCGRQMAITRVYWPTLFGVAAATHLIYAGFLALALYEGAFVLLGAVLAPGIVGGGLRAAAIADLAPEWREAISRHRWAYSLLVPAAGLLTLVALGRALGSRRIEWRGKIYEMRSPYETKHLGDAITPLRPPS